MHAVSNFSRVGTMGCMVHVPPFLLSSEVVYLLRPNFWNAEAKVKRAPPPN